jgi:triosephosphate isomerase (TIM)
MKRKVLIGGNWKMNLNVSQASVLMHRLHERIQIHRDIEIVIAPSFICLQPMSMQIDRRKFRLMAQNGYHKDEGAYTGEVSMTMLRDLVPYVIVGHSERRHILEEHVDVVRDKVTAAVRNGITPWLCIGEKKDEQLRGETEQVLHDQLFSGLSNLTAEEVAGIVIAYEPVWAIGSGESAVPDQVASAVRCIRKNIREIYGEYASHAVRVVYGGSVKEHNARAFLEVEGVDGFLVGGASLNYHEFAGIVQAAYRSLHDVKAVVGG